MDDRGTFLFVQVKTQLTIAANEIGVLASVIQRISAVSCVFGMLFVEILLLAQMDSLLCTVLHGPFYWRLS